jgi:hypothetical protein
MSTTAKAPKPLRMNQRAVLVPVESFARWHEIASATAGLTDLDRQVLDAVAGYYAQGKGARPLTFESLSVTTGERAVDISIAIRHLISLGLIAVQPGAGSVPNVYLPALPKRLASSMLAAAAEDVPAF